MSRSIFIVAAAAGLFPFQALAQEAPKQTPPSEVCLTNACSTPAAKAPYDRTEVAQARVQAQMSFMQAGYFRAAPTRVPDGSRVDIRTSLKTETGEVLSFSMSPGPGETSFAHNDPGKTPYMIGVGVDASNPLMTVQAAFRLDGQDVVVPPQTLTTGGSVTAELPGGRQLTISANLRPETDAERARADLMRARMNEMTKNRPPAPK